MVNSYKPVKYVQHYVMTVLNQLHAPIAILTLIWILMVNATVILTSISLEICVLLYVTNYVQLVVLITEAFVQLVLQMLNSQAVPVLAQRTQSIIQHPNLVHVILDIN
jgi:hypothetical protein